MSEYLVSSRFHPHYGCFGTISEDKRIPSTGQYIMSLTTCSHGVDRCAVYYDELKALR